jgi:hypothetical protein
MSYTFKPTENFWESFYGLTSSQKESTRRAWKILLQAMTLVKSLLTANFQH